MIYSIGKPITIVPALEFFLIGAQLPFFEAASACSQLGPNVTLASIGSQAQNDAVQELVGEQMAWIGLQSRGFDSGAV